MGRNIPETMLTQPKQMAPITVGKQKSASAWVCAHFISDKWRK